jgi:hypothetical protein
MKRYSTVQCAACVPFPCTCRVAVFVLSILIASGGRNANAEWFNLNTTEDDVAAVGMLLARLETLRAEQSGGGISKVRLLSPSKDACMLPLHENTLTSN